MNWKGLTEQKQFFEQETLPYNASEVKLHSTFPAKVEKQMIQGSLPYPPNLLSSLFHKFSSLFPT